MSQRYIAPELTHFVRRSQRDASDADPKTIRDQQFAVFMKILREGMISFPPHDGNTTAGIQQNRFGDIRSDEANGMYVKQCVCFCDIPLQDLPHHAAKYSPFGIAFPKPFIVEAGGCPVFYIAEESRTWTYDPLAVGRDIETGKGPCYEKNGRWLQRGELFQLALRSEIELADQVRRAIDGGRVTDLRRQFDWLRSFLIQNAFGFVKPFSSSLADAHPNNWYFEREWRIMGNLSFTLADVCRLLIPGEYSRRLREMLPEYYGQISFLDGSGLSCLSTKEILSPQLLLDLKAA